MLRTQTAMQLNLERNDNKDFGRKTTQFDINVNKGFLRKTLDMFSNQGIKTNEHTETDEIIKIDENKSLSQGDESIKDFR